MTEEGHMNIGDAVLAMREGAKVARPGWNGKGMHLQLMTSEDIQVHGHFPMQEFVAMKTVDETLVPWLCSQTDLLAEDWEIVR